MNHRKVWGTLLAFATVLMIPVPGALAEEGEADEEVIVTGSYIKRKNQADVSSPLDTVGLEDIQAQGWSDLEDVM